MSVYNCKSKPEHSHRCPCSQHEPNDAVTEYLIQKGNKCTLQIFYSLNSMKMPNSNFFLILPESTKINRKPRVEHENKLTGRRIKEKCEVRPAG